MCTITWHICDRGYDLFMNRDERKSRAIAFPPEEKKAGRIRYFAPTDPDAGGTWIAANERGLSLALANLYGVLTPHPVDPVSRGLVIPEIIAADSAVDACRRMEALDLHRYRPFVVVAIGPGADGALLQWDSARLDIRPLAEIALPLATSSEGVDPVRARRRAFEPIAAGPIDAAALDRFHRSHAPVRSAASPCMHREDAETVSLTRITVREKSLTMRYTPGPPCEANSDNDFILRLEKGA